MIRRTVLALMVLALATTVLSGCRLRADVAVAVDGDGGGRLSYTVATDAELLDAAVQANADPLEDLASAVEQLPGWDVQRGADGQDAAEPTSEAAEGGASPLESVTVSTSFADGAALERVSGEFADALAAPELRPLDALRVEVDDDTVTLQGGAGLSAGSAVTDLGIRRRRADRALADSVTLQVTAQMPGEILDTNADDVQGDTAAWTIAPGPRRQLLVVARRPWTLARLASKLAGPAGLRVLAACIALAALVWWGLHRRRAATAAAPATATARRDGDGDAAARGDDAEGECATRCRRALEKARQALAPSRSARIRARSERT